MRDMCGKVFFYVKCFPLFILHYCAAKESLRNQLFEFSLIEKNTI